MMIPGFKFLRISKDKNVNIQRVTENLNMSRCDSDLTRKPTILEVIKKPVTLVLLFFYVS